MNQVFNYNEMLISRDNEGIIAELLKQQENCNVIWGQEYIIMNTKVFLDNNLDEIIEIMMKCRKLA